MDWVIWTIGAIILIGIIVGVYRGALRIAVSILTIILTAMITFYATPYVAQIVEEKTPLDDSVKEYVVSRMVEATDSLIPTETQGTGLTKERVEKVLKAAGVTKKELKKAGFTVEDIVNGTIKKEELKKLGISAKILDGQKHMEDVVEEVLENTEIPEDVQKQVIESADFPEIFKKLLQENNSKETYAALGVETFAQYVGTFFAKLLIHVATFLALFLLVTIIVRALVFALNCVNDIPVFGIVNRLAGGMTGIVCALVVVWFLLVFVTLFYTTNVGKEIYETVQANAYTKIIMDNNPLLNISIKNLN